jgi:hypothetical protein
MSSNWGGLNNALASWRAGLNKLFPNRSTASDGGRADSAHSSTSEHQPDSDGTVDAFDEDRNYLGSSDQDGSPAEDRILAALNADFMADPRAHLIISDRTIRNDEIGNWRVRPYSGPSPHTEHTHRQAHQSTEDDGRPWKFTRTLALLRELNGGDVAFSDDKIKITATTGRELFEPDLPAGAEVDAATLLQLSAIWGKRGAENAAALKPLLEKIAADVAEIKAKLAEPDTSTLS